MTQKNKRKKKTKNGHQENKINTTKTVDEVILNDEIPKENSPDKDVVKDTFSNIGDKLSSFFKKVFSIIKQHFKLIVTVAVVLLTLINVTNHLVGSKVTKDYNDYSRYEIDYNQILNKKGTYYVYFYYNECDACQKMKRYIFQYIDSGKSDKNDGIPLYIFNIKKEDENGVSYLEKLTSESGTENILGVTDVKDLKLVGTPTMILIGDKEVKNSWSSTSKIQSQLKN